MSELISEAAMQAAVDYLNGQSDKIASARANVLRTEYKIKAVYARLFLKAHGNIEERKCYAYASEEWHEANERHVEAQEAWEYARDQRNRAEMIIEAWRSQEASKRGLGRVQ